MKTQPLSASSVEQNKRYFSTSDIFQGGKEVLIEHHGEYYQLRITRNGKLILTK